MSKKANPTLIGAFVLGALIIAIGVIVFFGVADLFSRKQTFVSFFDQSVSGLAPGSNVKFKGVTLGKVIKVVLGFKGESNPTFVEVYYQVDSDLVVKDLGININLFDQGFHKRAIERGLRAKLDFESIISGQLFVSLDFFKDASPPEFHPGYPTNGCFEVPTQASDIQAILDNLTKAISNVGRIDFLSLAKDLQAVLNSARDGISSLKLDVLGTSLNHAASSINDLVTGDQVKGALTSVQGAFQQLQGTLKKLDTELDPISANLNPTLEEAKKMMGQLQASTQQLDQLLRPTSGFRYQLDGALGQITAAAEALQRLSEFLERNPNSIFFGRKPAQVPH